MIWLVLSIVLTVLLVVLNNKEIVSDEFAGWCFPVTAMVSIILGVYDDFGAESPRSLVVG